MNTMQTSTAPAPRRTSLDDSSRLTTEPAPLCGMGYERAAIAAAGLAGEVLPAFDFTKTVLTQVFARFSFGAGSL